MPHHREPFSKPRILAIVFLAILLLVLVILSVKYDTAHGRTVDQWHRDNPDASVPQLLNINTATLEELMQLENMGEVTAQRIIEHRKRFDRFTSVDELAAVPGISEADLALWRPRITV